MINTKQNNNSDTKCQDRCKEFIKNTNCKIESIFSLSINTINAKQFIDQCLNYSLRKSINNELNNIDILSRF